MTVVYVFSFSPKVNVNMFGGVMDVYYIAYTDTYIVVLARLVSSMHR